MSEKRPTWAEIDLSAVRQNVLAVRGIVGPDVGIMAVVKADAYGHGAVAVARAALDSGADMLGVAILDEAVELRTAGVTAPVQILGCSLPDQAYDIVRFDITQTVSNDEMVVALSGAAQRLGRIAKVHVKVDTGMGRVGVSEAELPEFLDRVSRHKGILVEGLMTHYPSADEKDDDFTSGQIDRFAEIIRTQGVPRGIRYFHASNSAGIARHPKGYFNLVRPGLILYGAMTIDDPETRSKIRPALQLKSQIVQIRRMSKGDTVSYGRTYRLQRDTLVAVIPIGYADGYPRSLSNRAYVLVNGVKVPVIGRVCMDQCLVDIGDAGDVRLGQTVTLLGTDGLSSITVEEVAEWASSIPHEFLCTIGKRVHRVYING